MEVDLAQHRNCHGTASDRRGSQLASPPWGTFSDLFARLDPDPRVRGKQFEHVCKWFLTIDQEFVESMLYFR